MRAAMKCQTATRLTRTLAYRFAEPVLQVRESTETLSLPVAGGS